MKIDSIALNYFVKSEVGDKFDELVESVHIAKRDLYDGTGGFESNMDIIRLILEDVPGLVWYSVESQEFYEDHPRDDPEFWEIPERGDWREDFESGGYRWVSGLDEDEEPEPEYIGPGGEIVFVNIHEVFVGELYQYL